MLQTKDSERLNGYKNKTHVYPVYKKPASDLKTHRLKVRWWKNIFHASGKQNKTGVAILISDKIDLKIKNITRDKEGYYILIKGSIHEEDITIVNIYTHNTGAPQYIRQTLIDIKGEIDSNTITVGDSTPHSHQWTDHQNKINKETHLKWYIRWDGSHWYLQDIPSKCRRIQVHMEHSPG